MALDRGIKDALPSLEKFASKNKAIDKYVKAYQNYCWTVESIDDYKLAPFHILATEGQVHVDKTHEWHMTNIEDLCKGDSKLFMATPYKIVDLKDQSSFDEAVQR